MHTEERREGEEDESVSLFLSRKLLALLMNFYKNEYFVPN
jgi:hypothetical protein